MPFASPDSSDLSPDASRLSPSLSPGEGEMISIFVQMTQVLGLPRSLGEIYGLLFASPKPLAFQEIAERLNLSKGSVSQGLRFLRTIGAIKPVVITGDRREYFEPEIELRALVGGFLRERLNPQLELWGARAKALKIDDFVAGERREARGGRLVGGRTGGEVDGSAKRLEATSEGAEHVGGLRADGSVPIASGLEPIASSRLSAHDAKVIEGRIEKLKTWQKRANAVLPMVGKLLG